MSRLFPLVLALVAGCAYEAPEGTYAVSQVSYADNGCEFEDGGIFEGAKYELTQQDDVVELVYVGDPEVVFDGMDEPYLCELDGREFTCPAATWTLATDGATMSFGHAIVGEFLDDVEDTWRAGVFVDMTCEGDACVVSECQSSGLILASLE
jgi:hypothetical protein